MKLETFVKKTGWPIEELRAMDLDTFEALLAPYGLTWDFSFAPIPGSRNRLMKRTVVPK